MGKRIDNHTVAVAFPGHGLFWWLKMGDGSGPLAHLADCDAEGNIKDDSYAHVLADGRIMRYRREIGHRDQLKEVARPIPDPCEAPAEDRSGVTTAPTSSIPDPHGAPISHEAEPDRFETT